MDALQPGDPQFVGPYRLLHRLGAGGMGRVYLGQSPDGAMVAVKLIRPDLAGSPAFRRRFAGEVAAARRVSGPFTAPVVDADPDGAQPWLVTAYVAGPSLADAIATHGPLGVPSVRVLAAGLASGLRTVHAAGLVHRDLKPSNVLLAIDGPRIIDFGISRATDSSWLTSQGRVIGSPGFMSPEQAADREVGPAADIFSLGGVLAFAASGRPPFGSGPPSALLYRVVYGSPQLGHVPSELRPVIERCLAKDPGARPAMAELVRELDAATQPGDWLSRHAPFFRVQHAEPRARPATAGTGPAVAIRSALHATRTRDPGDAASADRTRPARYPRYARYARPWHSRAVLTCWSLVLVLAAGAASGAVLAGHHALAPASRGPAAGATRQEGAATRPGTGALPGPRTDQRKQAEQTADPRTTVLAYFAAINAHEWHQAWQLGGSNLSPSYHAMIAGFAGTVLDKIQSIYVAGDQVTVSLRAYQAGGIVRSYRMSYQVRDGVIATGTVLASSVIAQPDGGPQVPGTAEPRARNPAVTPGGSVLPRAAGNALVYLDVPGPGGGDDLGRNLGTWRLTIPVGDGGGPVPQELLVQVPLRAAWSPFGSRPEPG